MNHLHAPVKLMWSTASNVRRKYDDNDKKYNATERFLAIKI